MTARCVYIAAPLEERDSARALAAAMSLAGFRVLSTWHCTDVTRQGERTAPDWEISRALAANEAEIDRAHVVVVYRASKGRETLVEMGRALARGIPVIAVDPDRIASYIRPGVEWIDPMECDDTAAAIAAEILAL